MGIQSLQSPLKGAPLQRPLKEAPLQGPLEGAPLQGPLKGAPLQDPLKGAPLQDPRNLRFLIIWRRRCTKPSIPKGAPYKGLQRPGGARKEP